MNSTVDWRGRELHPKLIERNLARSRASVVKRMTELLNRAEELGMEPYPSGDPGADPAIVFSWGGHDTSVVLGPDQEWVRRNG